MNISTLLQDCIHFEEPRLAYYILHLLDNQLISLDDDITRLDFRMGNEEEVEAMIKENRLGFHPIKIFSLKMEHNLFFFIFAQNREEAIQYYVKSFQKRPLHCHELLLDYEMVRKDETLTFREMKKEHMKFPALAGYYEGEY